MTMTPVGHHWSLTFLACLLAPIFIAATPINRQVGISENVFITVQNDTYGIEQRVCSIDSMTYGDGETIPTSSPCEHCICRPPGFACTIISCEYRPGCKSFKRSNQCCPEYQCECEKDGKIYQNGEKIMDSHNPCEICYCQGGEIICAVIDCYWRSDCQPRYIENRCCPLYDHCPPPSNAGAFPRPTIPTTTTSSGFPWFNFSSAVYEVTAASSVTPEPIVQSSTSPTTTPQQPELIVVATQETPIQTNILTTAQEEGSNDTSAVAPDSQPDPQGSQELTEEGLSLQGQQELQGTIPMQQTIMNLMPVHPEVDESGSGGISNSEYVSETVPNDQAFNVENDKDSVPASDSVAVNSNAVTVDQLADQTVPVEQESSPVLPNAEANESAAPVAPNVDINEPLVIASIPEVNEPLSVAPYPEVNPSIDLIPSEEVKETIPQILNLEVNNILPESSNAAVNESPSASVEENVNSVATNEAITEIPEVDLSALVNEVLPGNPEVIQSVPTNNDEVHSSVLSNMEVSSSVHVHPSSVAPANTEASVTTEEHFYETNPEVTEVKESVPHLPIGVAESDVLTSDVPEIQDSPEHEVSPVNHVLPEIQDPEISSSKPEEMVSLLATPVVFQGDLNSNLVDPITSSPIYQEAISQSESIVPSDDQLVEPTETLPMMMVTTLKTETISETQYMPSHLQNVAGPSDLTVVNDVINPSTVLVQSQLTASSSVSEIAEVPTTGSPLSDPSVSFDELPHISDEVEETTIDNAPAELPQTEGPAAVNNPIPSIATILMPPHREEFTQDSSTDLPVQDQESGDHVPVPSVELELPTEEFVSGNNQDELETPTTASAYPQNPMEKEKVQDEPVMTGTYLPTPEEQDPLVIEEVTTQLPNLVVSIPLQSNLPVNPPELAVVDPEMLEDSPVHIQGSESSEAGQSSGNVEATNELVHDSDDQVGKIPVESVTANVDLHSADESEVVEQEIESTTIPEVAVVSSDQVPSSPVETQAIESQNEEAEKVKDEPQEVVTSTPATPVPEVVVTEAPQNPDVVVPVAAENLNVNDGTFEIIPPESSDVPSSPEIQSQVRDKEEQGQEVPIHSDETPVMETAGGSGSHPVATPIIDNQGPTLVQNDAPSVVSDDDTIEIFAENFMDGETKTQSPNADKISENEIVGGAHEFNLHDDTVEILAAGTSSDSEIQTTTVNPVIPQKEEEVLEDEEEEIHPDDQHEDDQDQVVLTTSAPFQNDEALLPTTSASVALNENHEESKNQNEIDQVDQTPTTHSPIHSEGEELHGDEPDHVEQEDEVIGTTEATLAQNDDDSAEQSPMTTTAPSASFMNKVQKVAEILKSKDEDEVKSAESSSDSKFRLDLSAFEDSQESSEAPLKALASQEEVQSTSTPPITKLKNDEVVFDDVQQTQTTHLPLLESIQEESTEKAAKLSRDDIDSSDLTTTGSPFNSNANELRDDFSSYTTNNPSRSDSVTNLPVADGGSHPESEENFINDEESLGETTTGRASVNSFRQGNAPELTTVASLTETENETEVNLRFRSDFSVEDFVELTTGSPLGFAAEYHDDAGTTQKPEYRAESVVTQIYDDNTAGDATTTEALIFDEEQKSEDEAVPSTTLESEVVRGKSENISDDGTTTTYQDLLNDESVIVTTSVPFFTEIPAETTTTTTSKTPGRLDQMVIPEKGFPQIDPVAHEMIRRKEDKLARLDLDDDDSWFYQTFNKIRQLSGFFPTPTRERKLTRQPRDLSHNQEELNPIKSKTHFKKTKKPRGEEVKKSVHRKSFIPSRSFLFF